jgi:hypothetical protein
VLLATATGPTGGAPGAATGLRLVDWFWGGASTQGGGLTTGVEAQSQSSMGSLAADGSSHNRSSSSRR